MSKIVKKCLSLETLLFILPAEEFQFFVLFTVVEWSFQWSVSNIGKWIFYQWRSSASDFFFTYFLRYFGHQ